MDTIIHRNFTGVCIHNSSVQKIDIQFGCSEPQYDIYWNDTQS